MVMHASNHSTMTGLREEDHTFELSLSNLVTSQGPVSKTLKKGMCVCWKCSLVHWVLV